MESEEKDEKINNIGANTPDGAVGGDDALMAGDSDAVEYQKDKDDAMKAIRRFTDEDEEDDMGEISIKTIFGGDILQSKFFKRQIPWFIFVFALMILYTANRYSSQQDIIEIDNLRNKLQDVKYNALTESSELLNLSRQSNIEKYLRATQDSTLGDPTTPPFLIKNDVENENEEE